MGVVMGVGEVEGVLAKLVDEWSDESDCCCCCWDCCELSCESSGCWVLRGCMTAQCAQR